MKKFRVRDLETDKISVYYERPNAYLIDRNGKLWANSWVDGKIKPVENHSAEFASGIFDKNGKEIYECDIISCESPHHGNVVGEVVFYQGCFILEKISWQLSELSYIEIIGDIYQNTELLEEKE